MLQPLRAVATTSNVLGFAVTWLCVRGVMWVPQYLMCQPDLCPDVWCVPMEMCAKRA
jgi:hypothetical protein